MSRDRVARAVNTEEDWLATLDAHGVQYLILDVQHDDDMLRLVRSQPGWAVDIQDADAVLLARTRTPVTRTDERSSKGGELDV